jgi:hypothetical protein
MRAPDIHCGLIIIVVRETPLHSGRDARDPANRPASGNAADAPRVK